MLRIPPLLARIGAWTLGTLTAAAIVIFAFGSPDTEESDVALLNVSYDPTREFYRDINAAFTEEWQEKTGQTVLIRQSHGGSGKQARAVIDGLDADVVTLALAADIDKIAEISRKIPRSWQSRLPNNSAPYTSVIVFLVRKGNPKNIRDWGDLVAPGIQVITPNPKTSGGARWNYLAAWAYAEEAFNGDQAKIRDFIGTLYRRAPVLDIGARGATATFIQRGVGDVLIAWESEAYLALNETVADQFEIVMPSITILAEPPVSVVDGNLEAHHTKEIAQAYLQYLYSPNGQRIAAKHYFRPYDPKLADAADIARFKPVRTVTIDRAFGGWTKAQALHFSDGGIFDQIYGGK